jgi:hypothetical protein
MVVIIDECRDCRHHVVEQGSIVICDYSESAAARNLFVASWGPAYVTDCPCREPGERESGP